MQKYIKKHILNILTSFEHQLVDSNKRVALDRYMSYYMKSNKSIGSDQRSEISEKVYSLMRYRVLLDYLVRGKKEDWEKKLDVLYKPEFFDAMKSPEIPEYIRCSQNKELYQKMCNQYGNQKAFQLSQIMNQRAPLTLRINPLKITRQKFIKKWKDVELAPTEFSPLGVKIIQNKKFNLLQTDQYKNGFFEIQDQASQLAALQINCKPGDLVLDYCAGSGGKSLAIAHRLQGKGQIFLHDPRQKSILKAKNRMQRAGITNVQYHSSQQKIQSTIKGKIDWLILDLPCSGTGTIRRNPDIKLKFSEQWLNHHLALQQQIFLKGLKYLNRNGKIVYITCSILQQQNQLHIQKLMEEHKLKLVNDRYLPLLPERKGMDGFFAAVLTR